MSWDFLKGLPACWGWPQGGVDRGSPPPHNPSASSECPDLSVMETKVVHGK